MSTRRFRTGIYYLWLVAAIVFLFWLGPGELLGHLRPPGRLRGGAMMGAPTGIPYLDGARLSRLAIIINTALLVWVARGRYSLQLLKDIRLAPHGERQIVRMVLPIREISGWVLATAALVCLRARLSYYPPPEMVAAGILIGASAATFLAERCVWLGALPPLGGLAIATATCGIATLDLMDMVHSLPSLILMPFVLVFLVFKLAEELNAFPGYVRSSDREPGE